MADTALIQGAYAAAGGGTPDLAASRGMTKIADMIAEPIALELQKRRSEFEEFAEWELTRSPGLNDTEFTDFHNKLKDKKSDYLWGDSLSRAKIMREIGEMKAQQAELEDAKKEFAKSSKDDKGIGGSDKFILSDEAKALVEAMKGAPTWKNGVPGYMYNGKFYDQNGINTLVQQWSFDEQSSNVLSSFAEDITNRSRKTTPGVQTPFDWDSEYRKIMNGVVNKGSIRSLAEDEIIPGRSFYTDFVDYLQEGTYEQLGISQDMVDTWNEELSPEDGITGDDATAIIESLFMDDKMAKHYLGIYYTRYLEQNWNGIQNQSLGVNTNQPSPTWWSDMMPTNKLQGKIIEQSDGSKMWSAI